MNAYRKELLAQLQYIRREAKKRGDYMQFVKGTADRRRILRAQVISFARHTDDMLIQSMTTAKGG
jgi:hypothetical protein